jgi:hypothetical protein
MYNNEKIYSIELGEDLTLPDPPRERRAVAAKNKRPPRPAKPAPRPRPPRPSKPPSERLQFAPLVIFTYLLGPFSVHLNPENRGQKGMLTVGMVSGMAGLGMFAGRGFILDIIGKGQPLWPWAVIGALVLTTAFSVWARAAFLAAAGPNQGRHRLPALLRKPWAVGLVGLFAPGLGLLLAGCRRRGAAVIWSVWPVVAAVVLLANSMEIWSRNQVTGGASVSPVLLETFLLLAVGVVVAGLIGWITQALEGARQMMTEPVARPRIRADWYAAALMCVLIGVAAVWDPAGMARQMDSGGVILREKGFRVIPLELSLGAHRLDPAPAKYAVAAITLYEELGRRDEAVRLRKELDANLASYVAMVNAEGRGPIREASVMRSPEQEWWIRNEFLGDAGPRAGDRPPY